MFEVEMKVRADLDPVRDRLGALQGTLDATVLQADTYYDAPHRSFAETDEALRVRRECATTQSAVEPADSDDLEGVFDDARGEWSSRVTYKGPKVDESTKTRREIETAVGSGDDAGEIFDALGFEPAATVRKVREHYSLDGVTVTLDTVEDLGTFVECELETESDLDAARETVASTLRSLDLDPDDGIRTSYLGLLLDGD
jgi:adenylate cyclase class 2